MSNTTQIKRVIAIASGKGGVGKSTVAVNLAFTLKELGYKVGLLDMDLYGPSLPLLLGISNDTLVEHDAEKNMQPVNAHGMPSMSIGYLVDEKAPAIWRGPIASKAIQQLFYNTQWGALDYLIIDLPPGTGDIHLTLAQKITLQGIVMVTTPQMISLADVRKAIMMFQKVNIPLVGIIENMSGYQCSECGHTHSLFGSGGGAKLAEEYHTQLLGSIPLDNKVSEISDQGKPIVLDDKENEVTQVYKKIAQQMVTLIQKMHVRRFPEVVVE